MAVRKVLQPAQQLHAPRQLQGYENLPADFVEKSNSLEKMLAILDVFTGSDPVWTSDALIEVMEVSRSTGYRYIKTLHQAGLLAAVGNGSYILGPRILELDLQIRQSDPLYRLAGPALEQLSGATKWPALFCVLYSHSVMCIRSEGEARLPGFFGRGQRRPLFRGAASKVILAHLPGHQINKLFLTHHKAIALAKLGTDLDAFKQALKQIREDGFAKTTAEFSPGITGIASPVFNREGKILGSIGIGVQATKLRWNIAPALIESVRQAAQEVNTALSSIETSLDQPARAVG